MAEKIFMLALSPTMESGKIVKWRKKEGDSISSGDVICEVETDKAVMDYESPVDGTLLRILLSEGDSAPVGDVIAIYGNRGEDYSELMSRIGKSEIQPKPQAETGGGEKSAGLPFASKTVSGRLKASPMARRIAREMGLDLSEIEGTGPKGRIIQKDVENYKGKTKEGQVYTSGNISAEEEQRKDEVFRQIPVSGDIPVEGKRKVIAERMAESMRNAPHFYLKVSVDMEGIIKARESLNSGRKEKVSLNSFIIRLVAEVLKRHPMVNSSWQGDHISRFVTADIGLAVAVDDGLVSPVVRDCWNKGILQIDGELKEMVNRARENRLKSEDFQNPGFTLSNLGSYGIEEFTAIINPPGSAILALGQIMKTPVVEEDSIFIRRLMKMTLSCDHRVMDGVTGAEFLRDLKHLMENPYLLLI